MSKAQKFDIPINITVLAGSEQEAEKLVQAWLNFSSRISGPDYFIQDWEYFEFHCLSPEDVPE